MNPPATTLPLLLARNAAAHPERIALREKTRGLWKEITWARYHARVRDFSLGLTALGFARGQILGIAADNAPEWLIAELAAQATGGAAAGLDPGADGAELERALRTCGATFAIAEDQEQVDKILASIDRLPALRAVIHFRPRGLREYRHPLLHAFTAVEERGHALHAEQPARFEEALRLGTGHELAFLDATKGELGDLPAGGAAFSARGLFALSARLGAADPLRASDELVSFLPLSWRGEQARSSCGALLAGCAVNFPESPETALEDLREIGPHSLLAPPPVWEAFHSTVQRRMAESSPLRRFIQRRCLPVGERAAAVRREQRPLPPGLRALDWLAGWFLFRPIKDRLGLSRLRAGQCTGAPDPAAVRFFQAIGVPLTHEELS